MLILSIQKIKAASICIDYFECSNTWYYCPPCGGPGICVLGECCDNPASVVPNAAVPSKNFALTSTPTQSLAYARADLYTIPINTWNDCRILKTQGPKIDYLTKYTFKLFNQATSYQYQTGDFVEIDAANGDLYINLNLLDGP